MPKVARLLDNLAGDILLTGDLAYMNGSADEFRRCFDPDFGRFGRRLRPAPGNHDYGTPNGDGYFAYFGARAGLDRRGFYAFRAASWKILMLNSSVPVGRNSEQYVWVRRQLQDEPTRCTLAALHHPFDGSGTNGPTPWLRDMWDLLLQHGVELPSPLMITYTSGSRQSMRTAAPTRRVGFASSRPAPGALRCTTVPARRRIPRQ